ncbi:MAG: hypothetical protein HRT71_09195 [Flavobacteriales bacterium]|nr:hypothetical protein [Flavobacteriales bacterium]
MLEFNDEGPEYSVTPILEKDYHLSYPFVFEGDGTYYVIPEGKVNNNIELYKCLQFPFKWELEKVIMDDIAAIDTTVHFENGKYWLFTSVIPISNQIRPQKRQKKVYHLLCLKFSQWSGYF